MRFATLIERPADWMKNPGPCGDIVVTSRIRLARNLRNRPFPGWADQDANAETLKLIVPEVIGLPGLKDVFSGELRDLTKIEKQVLVERHLISREHAARSRGSAAIMNRSQSMSIMINEEDHLRMQTIEAGLNLQKAFRKLDKVDTQLEGVLDYAFDSQLGFLTACPSNVGTGLRASAMLHLPGLMLNDQMEQVVQSMNQLGVAVRGLHGEGSEALANLFQVSNQTTLGRSEAEIISRLQGFIEDIIKSEHNARLCMLQDKLDAVRDLVGRAYGTLRFAHSIASKEAMNHLSMLRLGSDVGFFGADFSSDIDALLMEIQPAHLQHRAGGKLRVPERDPLRSEILRDRLKCIQEPDINNIRESRFRSLLSQHPTNDE